jgi:type IV pilus assembly protein PilO
MDMAKMKVGVDIGRIADQFRGLQGRHPGLWPSLPRVALLAALFAGIVAAGYGLYWRGLLEDLERGRQQEEALKVQYRDKLRQAVNLEALRQQKEQVTLYVSQLEKQLPSKAEMDALLSDINQAGVGRGARLQLFKPGQVVIRDYYAELPITVSVVGEYHDLGSFASDLANLPRIVTLSNLSIQRDKTMQLTMDATAKTFRYLDPEEIAAQRAAAAAAAAAKAKTRQRGKQ